MRAFAWFLLLIGLSLACMAAFSYPAWLLLHPHFNFPFHRIGERIGMLGFLLGFLLLARRLKLADRFSLGFGAPRGIYLRELSIGLAIGAVTMAAIVGSMAALGLLEWRHTAEFGAGALAGLIAKRLLSGLAVGLIEETALRGAMFAGIQRESGTLLAVVLTSLVFAATHFLGVFHIPPAAVNPWSGVALLEGSLRAFDHPLAIADAFLCLTGVGAILAIVRSITGNTAASMGLHAGWVWVMLVVHELTQPKPLAPLHFLLSHHDGFTGWLVLGWTAPLGVGLWWFYRRRPGASSAPPDGQPGATGDGARASFLTLTHRGDIERFAILRRSIQLFAPGWPHLAVVDTEDRAAFERRFGGEPLLRIVSTRDVLPGWLERRRKRHGATRHLRRWLFGRPVKGWYIQQLAKIFALASLPFEAAVFVDSDVFLCRPLRDEEFFSDGRVKLLRRRAANAEDFAFDISTHIVLGNPLHRVTELYDYIFSPAIFRKSSAVALLAEFDRRRLSRRNKWLRRFIKLERPSEYNLLGYAATVLEGCAGYELTQCEPDALHHSIRFPEDRARLAAEIDLMCEQPKPFALIQSTLGIEPSVVAEVLERLAHAQAARC